MSPIPGPAAPDIAPVRVGGMQTGGLSRLAARQLSPARLLRNASAAWAAPSALMLRLRARHSHRPLTGDAPVVVSMTSYGSRLRTVHLALESIGDGRERPQRLILWLDDHAVVADPPRPLARLRDRGLEILPTTDWGPHKKYYLYVTSIARHTLPLVTADDDVLYGWRWLTMLLARHREHPDDVIAHRAHRMVLADGRIAPYLRWQDLDRDEAGPRTFATGHSGVLYPPAMLDALREAGDAFTTCAPYADDVWLHATAVRSGTTVRPVSDGLTTYRSVPRTQLTGLRARNVLGGGNDRQVAATYRAAEIELLWRDQLNHAAST